MEGARNRRHLRIGATARALPALLAIMLAAGCFSSSPRQSGVARLGPGGHPAVHVVQAGETLYHIAHVYGVSVNRLMAVNHVHDPHELRVGQRLVIPGAYSYASLDSAGHRHDPWDVPRASRQFAWPVWSGTVTSGFGMRHGAMHDGVDIAAPVGTPVHAAGAGVVAFVGRLHGYGNTVIIRHSDNYVTVYAHDSRNFVYRGEQVARGQTIGRIGTSGRTTGPNLHFEVRYDNLAYNPLSYLPPPGPSPSSVASFARNGPS